MKRNIIFSLLLIVLSTMAVNGANKPKIGLFLSGGGALGFAHIGVIQALEEVGIHPDIVAGASMGALVGTFYSAGFDSERICNMVMQEQLFNTSKIIALSGAQNKGLGISSHKKVRAILDAYLPTDSFDSLNKEMIVCVSNLSKNKTEAISTGGNLKNYVIASMSVPAVFEAVKINGDIYVDGGSLNHFPAYVIRDKVDLLIGIDVMPEVDNVEIENVADVISRYMECLAINSSVKGRKMCDYLIDCHANEKYKMSDFNKFEEIYKIGYETMKKFLKENPKFITACKGKTSSKNANWEQFWE